MSKALHNYDNTKRNTMDVKSLSSMHVHGRQFHEKTFLLRNASLGEQSQYSRATER